MSAAIRWVARVPAATDDVAAILPPGFPEPVFAAITAGLARTAQKLAASR